MVAVLAPAGLGSKGGALMATRKISRKRALSGRAQVKAAFYSRNAPHLPVTIAEVYSAAYQAGWRDCMAAARKELGTQHSLADARDGVDRLLRFLKPLR